MDAVRDDLDTLVLDADLLEAVLSTPDPKKAKEIEIKLQRGLRGHNGNLKFKKFVGTARRPEGPLRVRANRLQTSTKSSAWSVSPVGKARKLASAR